MTTKEKKNWICQECGRRMTTKAAERAAFGPKGCPGCGGSDIDLVVSDSGATIPAKRAMGFGPASKYGSRL